MAPSLDPIYVLTRDSAETKRLDEQHHLYTQALGYLIHPRIQKSLGPHAAIADIACGSGAMCLDWARTLPPTVQIYGLDISADQFPAAASLPPNLSFHVANAKHPFPEELKNRFDLVNLRLLVSAIEPEEWVPIARNIYETLKPGGAIQWGESNFEEAFPAVRSFPTSTTKDHDKLFIRALPFCKNRLIGAVTLLPKALTAAGFQDMEVDVCVNDRIAENRAAGARVTLGALIGVLRWSHAQKDPDAPSLEEMDTLVKGAQKDLESGAYSPHRLRVYTAFKPA